MRLGLGLGVNSITSQKIGAGFTGILDEYSGAAAAYSVRRLSSTYTDGLIRVRRSSDDTEQDIGFDANGDLDSTALLAFVNEDVDVYTSDFSSTEDLSEFNGTGAAAQSVGGVDDAYKFTLSGGNAQHTAFTSVNTLESGKSFTVVFDYYIPSGQTLSSIVFDNIGGSGAISGSLNVTDNWTTETINFTADGFRPRWWAGAFGANVNADGDAFYLKNIVVTQTTADGAVTTWYDQSGNGNDATNSTESEQPLVVSGGTLVTENGKAAINFTADYFSMNLVSSSTEASIISVYKNDPSGTYKTIIGNGNVNGYALTTLSGKYNLFYRNVADQLTTNNALVNSQGLIFAYTKSATNQTIYVNNTLYQNITPPSMDAPTTSSRIGAYDTNLGAYTGIQQELILFDSDQRTNRTGIESNINDYFDIYTP